MTLTIDRTVLGKMLLGAAQLLEEKSAQLSEIDSHFGDGDHGVTMVKIAKLIQSDVPKWGDASIKSLLDALGTAAMEVRGGSAGPLYGTMLSGFGLLLKDDESQIDADGAKRMLRGSVEAMQEISTAKVGDKTMMDALIPAAEAAEASDGGPKEVWLAAAAAAEAGAQKSREFVAKFGRAKSYKEETIGTPDAGAVSTSLILRGMADAL